MLHCDMGPKKFTYCPLRHIPHFTFFRYISHLQRYILQKAFISTFPQPESHTTRLFHRADALPLHGFFHLAGPQKFFFAVRKIFLPSPATHHATRPGRQAVTMICLPPESGGKSSMLMDGFFCAGGSVGLSQPPGPFLGVNSVDFPVNQPPPQNTPQQQQRNPQSFPFFSRFALASSPCQRFRQWIQKKGRECANTPRPAGQFPGISHSKVFCPCRSSSSYRGRLLSTVQPVGEQGHHDARHDLRGGI